MKRSILIFIIILYGMISPATVLPQSKSASKAQQYFDKREYALAIPEYEKDLKKKNIKKSEQARIEGFIGMSYYYLNKPKDATSWIKKSTTHGYNSATLLCINGLALQKQEKYEEALAAFRECLSEDPDYADIKLYIASCEYALAHTEPNEQVKLRSSKVNTDGSEYGISPAAGEVFFSRAATKGRDIDPRTGLGFTEVYSAKIDKDDLVKPQKEKTFMKVYYNTGVFAFDSIANYIYMTMCDPKSGRCGIYRSKYDRKKWDKPEPFFINESYDMAHPALAKGGSRLYFTSNAPGGFGKTDIWYVDRRADNQWSEPMNAGDKINTAGRDEFPFVEKDRLLYYSSNGHAGFGGLDVFMAAIDGDQIGEVKNLGRPFNSGADDFNLITYGDKGLMVSSRNIPKSDDIYIFNKKEIPSPTLPEKVEEETVPAIDSVLGVKPRPVISEPLVVQPETKPETKPVVQPEEKPVVRPAKPEHVIATIYFDFKRFVPQREYRNQYDEIASLMRSYPNAVFEIAGYADDRGGSMLNRELSDKRAQYIAERLIDRGVDPDQLVVKGYGFDNPAIPNASDEAEYQQNRRVEIRIIQTSKP